MMRSNTVVRPADLGIKSNHIDRMPIKAISWGDFRGEVPDNQWYLAHIYWNIEYTFMPTDPLSKLPKITTRPSISAKSWKKDYVTDNQDLLRHEYGHYLIGCACALDLQTQVNSAQFHNFGSVEAYKEWVKNLFRTLMKKYCQMERKYDQETEHYCNETEQKKWEDKLANMINSYVGSKQLVRKDSNKESRYLSTASKNMKQEKQEKQQKWRIRDSSKKPPRPSSYKVAIKV